MFKTGIIFVLFTSNNIICSLTDLKGNVIGWTSGGSQRSKGLKKLVPLVLHSSIIKISSQVKKLSLNGVHVKLKGLNKSKRIIIKTLNQVNIKIFSFQDITSLPHNGCRIKKQRRL